ncbi:tRNA(Ile)-lysidine synthase [compost metagenome]
MEAVNVYKNVIIRFVNTYNEEKSKKANILLKKEELNNNIISFNECDMEFTVSSNEGNLIFSDDSLVKYFDYDKISKNIEVRLRKDGDRMKPLGMSGRKKIKDIFIDFKIPKDNRDFIPIVCFDDEIAWVVGIKTSEEFKINKSTKKILKIKLIRKEQ